MKRILGTFFFGCYKYFVISILVSEIPGASWARAEEFSWKNAPIPKQAGQFPEVPPLHARYEFGWTWLSAANAEVTFYYSGDHYFFSASGGTYGWARRLWQIDATQTSSGFRGSWLPEKMHQIERYRTYTMIMDVRYNEQQADRLRMAIPTPGKVPGRKVYAIANMRDMVAAMLFVRSQPLRSDDQVSQVVFPGDSVFFIQTRVVGREMINYAGKLVPTIKFSISMKRIVTEEGPQEGSLVPHRKFNSGVIWITDDAKRIPVRAELSIFIGYVYAQLQSVRF